MCVLVSIMATFGVSKIGFLINFLEGYTINFDVLGLKVRGGCNPNKEYFVEN